MRNPEVVSQIRLLPATVLASLVPHLRPFDCQYELRQEFAAWVSRQSEKYGSWQAAWNRWTHASPSYAGSVSLTVTCSECRGRGLSLRCGSPGMCVSCMGRRRVLVRTPSLYQPPR